MIEEVTRIAVEEEFLETENKFGWRTIWTTCNCRKFVELKKNNMGWKVSDCGCGTHIRINAEGNKMIVETFKDHLNEIKI